MATTKKTTPRKKTTLTPQAPKPVITEPRTRVYINRNCDTAVCIDVNGKTVLEIDLTTDTLEISCGVNQAHQLPTQGDYRSLFNVVKDPQEREDLVEQAFRMHLDAILKEEGKAFLILSNTVNASTTFTNKILGKICAETDARRNPNSGNNIKIFIY